MSTVAALALWIGALLATTGTALPTKAPKCIAHRGLHNNQRQSENTKEAISAAVEKVDGVEFDVRFTFDGFAVIHHDQEVRGCGKIARQSLAELQECDPQLPLVEDVLPVLSRSSAITVIELKEPYRQNSDPKHDFLALLRSYFYEDMSRLWLISFDEDALESVRTVRHRRGVDGARVLLLKETWPDIQKARDYDGVNVRHRARVNRRRVALAKKRGLMVGVWHLAPIDILQPRLDRLVIMGVDFITTDRPEQCQMAVRNMHASGTLATRRTSSD